MVLASVATPLRLSSSYITLTISIHVPCTEYDLIEKVTTVITRHSAGSNLNIFQAFTRCSTLRVSAKTLKVNQFVL